MKNSILTKYLKNRRFSFQFQQMLMLCLIVFTLCIGFPHQAQARDDINPNSTLATPPKEPQAYQAGKNAVTGVSEGINNTLENVKEKLNLDEPLPESTKEFLANPLAKPKNQNPPERPVGPNV